MTIGRLAPTPSGRLHLGNITAFAAAWLSVRAVRGELLLRIEDVDVTRSRPAFEADVRRDLIWLGLGWDRETRRQSERDYLPVLDTLAEHTYHCTCTRKQIRESGGTYRGTCRDAGHDTGSVRLRLPPGEVVLHDRVWGERHIDPTGFGDPVLRRRDEVFAYNLAVVADDIADGVTEVVRGADLLDFTAVQIHLWRMLGAEPPTWMHSPLVLGMDGRKLSKSHRSTEIAELRHHGWTPRHIWRTVLPWLGIEGPDSLERALDQFDPHAIPRRRIELLEDPPARPRLTSGRSPRPR